MSSELKDTLKKRLDENYTVFIESLQEKTVSELIAMAPDFLTGLHQPQAHVPRRLILLGILRVSDRREHEMGADRDVARLEHLLGFLAGGRAGIYEKEGGK